MKLNLPTILLFIHLICRSSTLTAQDWTAAVRYSSQSNSTLSSTSTALAADGSQYVVGNFRDMVCFDTIVLNAPTPDRTWGYLLKLDAQMQPVWAKKFPEAPYDITVDAEGNLFVVGSRWNAAGTDDSLTYVAKHNNDGELLATFYSTGDAGNWGKVVRTDAAGNCYVAGERFSSGTVSFGNITLPGGSGRQCFILRLSPNLSQVNWAVFTGSSSNLDNVYDLEIDDANGFVYASGNYSQSFSIGCFCYNGSFFVEKHNAATGAQVWKKVFAGGSGNTTKQFARLSPDGQKLALAACFKNTTQFEPGFSLSTNAGNTDYHIYLAEINTSNGTTQWANKISSSGDSYLWRMARKQDEIWLFGYFRKQTQMGQTVFNPAGQDAFLTKVAADGTVLEAERLFGNSAEWGLGLAQRDTILAVTGTSNSTSMNIGTFVLPGATNSAYAARKGGLPLLPPVADFSASPTSGCAPLTVAFNNKSYQNASTFLWSLPGATPSTSTTKNPTVTYNIPGVYPVTLRVFNGAGSDTLVQAGYIHVAAAAPSAAFNAAANGLEISFSNTSVAASSYLWDFGDGQTSTEQHPVHTYADCGTYEVVLTTSNACGTATAMQTITAGGDSPTADFGSATNGLSVAFFNLSINANSYLWDFGDGQTSTEQHPVHNYADCGTYEVVLTTSNACGTATAIQTITAGTGDPTAGFGAVPDGLTVELSDYSINAETYFWDFGDGQTSTLTNPMSHVYADSGTYLITLIVGNLCGADTFQQSVTTLPCTPPEVDFFADKLDVCVGETVLFTNLSTNAGALLWTFPGGDPMNSTVPVAQVSYTMPGLYAVVLNAVNACGNVQTIKTEYILVRPEPTAGFEATVNGPTVVFDNLSEDALSYLWDFGDGLTSDEPNPEHTYTADGIYTVTLTVSNDCGTVSHAMDIQISLVRTSTPSWLEQARVFPNPSAGQFWVELQGKWEDNLTLNIINASGQLIRAQNFDTPGGVFIRQFDLSDVPSGVYWLQVRSGANVWVRRLVLNAR